jgi:hypothetical protein
MNQWPAFDFVVFVALALSDVVYHRAEEKKRH